MAMSVAPQGLEQRPEKEQRHIWFGGRIGKEGARFTQMRNA